MNWKALLPAAALLVLFVPSAAYSRNHHGMMGGMNMMSPLATGGQFMGGATHGISSFANSGINPYAAAAPVASVAPFAANALVGSGMGIGGIGAGLGSGLLGMNNGGMFNNGMMCGRHHHHKHKRRNLLNALMMQNNGYGNYGYGSRGLFGNSYGYGGGYGGYGGYGGGLTGGLRNVLGRL